MCALNLLVKSQRWYGFEIIFSVKSLQIMDLLSQVLSLFFRRCRVRAILTPPISLSVKHHSCCVTLKLKCERSNSGCPGTRITGTPSLPHSCIGDPWGKVVKEGRLTLISLFTATVAILHGEYGANDQHGRSPQCLSELL